MVENGIGGGLFSVFEIMIPNGRTPKQCSDRYNNSLKPDGKKAYGQWTEEEDRTISRLHAVFGNGAKSQLVGDVIYVER